MSSPGDFERQKDEENEIRPYVWRNDSWMIAVDESQLADKKYAANAWFGDSTPKKIGESNNKEEARSMAVDWMRRRID